jgi:hypothetical protein
MAESKTSICNMAVARVGNKGDIQDFDTDTSEEARVCRLFYDQVVDSSLRSYDWTFAKARVVLSQSTDESSFEFDSIFDLPSDYMRQRHVYDDVEPNDISNFSYSIEGNQIFINRLLSSTGDSTTINFKYIKRELNTGKWDPLFTEIVILTLAVKIAPKLTDDPSGLVKDFNNELQILTIPLARTVNRFESPTTGAIQRPTWNSARQGNTGFNFDG